MSDKKETAGAIETGDIDKFRQRGARFIEHDFITNLHKSQPSKKFSGMFAAAYEGDSESPEFQTELKTAWKRERKRMCENLAVFLSQQARMDAEPCSPTCAGHVCKYDGTGPSFPFFCQGVPRKT